MARKYKIDIIILVYALVACVVAYFGIQNDTFVGGADTMFYVYRGDLLYHSIKESGNWYPLLDLNWYNGVQTFRFWSPFSSYILAGCQALVGGDPFDGFGVFVGVLCFCSAIVWLYIGVRHDRPWLGAFLGLIWFFIPNNMFMLYTEGVLARSISMIVLPLFVVAVQDYLTEPRWKYLLQILLSFVFIIMCHLGWAGMLLIALLIFFFFYRLMNRKQTRGRYLYLHILCTVLIAFLITGIWTYASLRGGITTKDSSDIMASYFQSLNWTINPFYGLKEGYLNRWDFPAVSEEPYFGLVAFSLAVFGSLFSLRKTSPGFLTGAIICLLTASAAYPLLVMLPGSQYLWMLRFISIALTFLLVAFFFWRTLRKPIMILFCILLLLESVAAYSLFVGEDKGTETKTYYDIVAEKHLLDVGKEITTQRMSAVEPFNSVLDAIYVIAGYGEDAVPTSYGQGIQAAATYRNIVQINEASEHESYLYVFDRCLELGNDTVLVPVSHLESALVDFDVAELDAAAERVGYQLVTSNESDRLYHIDTYPTFGTIDRYPAIGIGEFAPMLSLSFPAIQETSSTNLNDYSFEELSKYQLVYLAGFTYTDKEEAEELVIRLSEAGVRVVILADGIPVQKKNGLQEFLGVECHGISFSNGYPELYTQEDWIYCDLFPDGYADWKTVYLNGLTEVLGTLEDGGKELAFYGTVQNENIIMVGINLTYHYALTGDETVGALLEDILGIHTTDLPERTLVPLEISYEGNTITIVSEYDKVNTTLGYQDNFHSRQRMEEKNYLVEVDAGTTVIELRYPYLLAGGLMSLVGIVSAVVFLTLMRKKEKLEVSQAISEKAETESGQSEEEEGQYGTYLM